MSIAANIRAHVERRIPGALTVYERRAPEVFPTGIAAIDQEIVGIPKGALTQICAPAGASSGRTSLLLSLLAQTTGHEEFCALVDATDSFDPESACAMGVCLSRLLWVRGAGKGMKSLEQAFTAADILMQNGGFGFIALNLSHVEEKLIRKIPLTTWFRFARVMEKTSAALVVFLTHSAAQGCAALTLHLGEGTPRWQGAEELSHSRLVSHVEFSVEIARSRIKKPVHGARSNFTARPQWA